MKHDSTANQPRIAVGASVAQILLDKIKQFDRLAFHFRERRRSNSASVIRFAAPF
jgi:hypothetical protein